MADPAVKGLASRRRLTHLCRVRNFRKIAAWQRADALVDSIYLITDQLPVEERYSLVTQMRRAGLSIPANIAEGAGRESDADFERFLSIAAGSSSEIQYFLEFVARRWPEVSGLETAMRQADEVKRMLRALQNASRRKRA